MSTTGQKDEIDQELLSGLKVAKSHRCLFACVVAGATKGALIVQKSHIEPTAISQAKKNCGGSMSIEGACFYENGTYIFETEKEAPQTLPSLLKLVIKAHSGLVAKVECRTATNSDLLQGSSDQGNQPQSKPSIVMGASKLPPVPPPRQRSTSAPTVMKSYATETDWQQKIAQVDRAKIPTDRKITAYNLIETELNTDVGNVATDTTLDTTAKFSLQAAHKRVQVLLTQQRNAATVKANRELKQNQLIQARRSGKQRATVFLGTTNPKIETLNSGLDDIVAPYSEQAVSGMSDKTDSDDSKFKSVISAMNIFRGADELLKKGKLPYAEFNKVLLKVQEEATKYRQEHKSALTSSGKKRIKQCDQVLESVKETQRLISAKMNEIQAILRDVLEEIQRGGVCPEMRDKVLPDLLKFPYLSMEFRPQIEKTLTEVIRLLKTKTDQALQNRPNATSQERAEVLLQFGGSTPPKDKGQSDSFFINNPDGTPAYIFKSQEGEARNTVDWPEGGGAPREILASKMNELMKKDLRIDLKIAKTNLFETEDENFKQGSKSQAPKRSGALQEAIPLDPTKDVNPRTYLEAGQELDTKIKSLNPDDAESIALLDFITLNVDRHAENMLMQNVGDQPGQTRLVPIDAGQMFPTKDAFRISSANMANKNAYDPNRPVIGDGSLLMQLPGAQQPFSQKNKDAIAKLDPDAFVNQMKSEYADLVREAPDMAGKVDDSSFDLMKRSITLLKEAAAHDLTQRQISEIYARGFTDIMDCQDNQLDAAIKKAVADSKKVAELGGAKALLEAGFDPTKWSIAHQREILEKKLSQQDAKKMHYAELQTKLTDLPTYLLFDSGQAFQLGDWLTRPYSDQNYDFLEMAADWKRIGGDPRLRLLLTGEPVTCDKSLKEKIVEKFGIITDANEFYKMGGYPALREALGDTEFAKQAGRKIWQQRGDLEEALKKKKK